MIGLKCVKVIYREYEVIGFPENSIEQSIFLLCKNYSRHCTRILAKNGLQMLL